MLLSKKFKDLDKNEKRTFLFHFLYSLCDGFILGVLALNEFVFLKCLNGTSWELGALFQFSLIVFLFMIVLTEWFKYIRFKQKLVLYAGILSRLPLISLFFFPNFFNGYDNQFYHLLFLAVFFIYYLGNPIIFPNINLFLKNNYKFQNFGRLYSWANLANKMVMMLTTFLYGFILDQFPFSFRYFFLISAIIGVLSVIFLSKIDFNENVSSLKKFSIRKLFVNSYKTMRNILIINKPYLHYQIGFMVYGIAYMSTATIIFIFFEKDLNISYSGLAFYKNSYNLLSFIIIPYLGLLIGKIDPRRFAAYTFAAMALFLLSLILTFYYRSFFVVFNIKIYLALISYVVFYAIYAAQMGLLWSIGSAYFCKPNEAADYHAIHLFLSAVRAAFAPLIGVLLYEMFGYVFTFAFGVVTLIISIIIMIWSQKNEKIKIV